jgi:hypothetical protein
MVSQDFNVAPMEGEVIVQDAEEPHFPLTQPTPQERLFQEQLEERLAGQEIAVPQRPTQHVRTILPTGQPRSGPQYPSSHIFPPLEALVPLRLAFQQNTCLSPSKL